MSTAFTPRCDRSGGEDMAAYDLRPRCPSCSLRSEYLGGMTILPRHRYRLSRRKRGASRAAHPDIVAVTPSTSSGMPIMKNLPRPSIYASLRLPAHIQGEAHSTRLNRLQSPLI
jgi:hypothetical protein